ncbi:MAG: RNA polymerase sigma factor, partial [Holophagales bacterium]|nr:RNA polymerase sigma factor [Holophagales bacterium]
KRAGEEVSLDDVEASTAPPQDPADPLSSLVKKEQRRAMRDTIAELPEKMRQCLTLRLDQELSYAEIAVVMRLEINTVKAHLFQARQRLSERLAVRFPEEPEA